MQRLSRAVVEQVAAYLDDWISIQRKLHRVPGIQVALLHDDEVVLSAAHGYADLEREVPLTTDHRFRIASHSKTFTATAVLQLVEEGRLRLDDRLEDHVEFLRGAPAGRVAVREVMAHGGGLVRDGWDGDFWQLFRAFPDRAELERISTDDADVLASNERFKYSNIGYGLLGQVIEAVTGAPYAAHVTERIIRPLGLQATGPDVGGDVAAMATGYSALSYADRRVPIDSVATGALASATGFYSIASDVVRYASGHFEGDERLLSAGSKRLMQRTEWKVEGSAERSYGLGFAVAEIGGRRVLGHGGGFPGHITHTAFDPVEHLAVSALTNCIDGPAQALTTGAWQLANLAAQSVGEPDPGRQRFCGRFANLWGVFDIVELGGQLHRLDPTLADPTADRWQLEVAGPDTLAIVDLPGYASPGERYEFEWAADGSVSSIRGGSATTSLPFERFAEVAGTWERVELGSLAAPT